MSGPLARVGGGRSKSVLVLALLDDGTAALVGALAALDAATLDGNADALRGGADGRRLQLAVYEFAFHADDLRVASDQAAPFPADVAAAFVASSPCWRRGSPPRPSPAGQPAPIGWSHRPGPPRSPSPTAPGTDGG